MMKYQNTFIISEKDLSLTGDLLPSAILTYFQSVATAHAEELGVGYQVMVDRNLFWVVTQIRYQVLKVPSVGQRILVETWPLAPNRLCFERDYRIFDEQGELLIKGASNWVVIDCVERKLASAGNLYPGEDYYPEKAFEDRMRRLRDFDAEGESIEIIPDESMIDGNGHVNNTFYPAFAVAALKELPAPIREFQIDYLHEVLCGQPLKIEAFRQPDQDLVKGLSAVGTRMFTCSITY